MVINCKNHFAWGVSLLLALVLCVSECNRRKEKRLAGADLIVSLDSVTYYKNKLGLETAGIKVLQLNNKMLKAEIIERDKEISALAREYASIKSIVKVKQISRIDTIHIPFKKHVSINFRKYDSIRTKYYSFNYEIDSSSLSLQNFTIPNETNIITGYKRKWFLGRQTLTTDITHSNPYISTKDIVSAEVFIPEPWYKKWYLWLATGLVTGALIK